MTTFRHQEFTVKVKKKKKKKGNDVVQVQAKKKHIDNTKE